MNTRCFFAHIAFSLDARAVPAPDATANMLIEVNDAALISGGKKKHLKLSKLTNLQEVKLAGGIARTAALDYVKSEPEFCKFPVRRFVDFGLAETPTYISIRPPPTRILPDDCKVWRLAETESERVRTEPLPGLSQEKQD
jgi:hypothetical protein